MWVGTSVREVGTFGMGSVRWERCVGNRCWMMLEPDSVSGHWVFFNALDLKVKVPAQNKGGR